MTTLHATQPTNINDLSPVASRLAFHKIPNVVYRSASVPLPGIQLGETEQASPLQKIPWPGTEVMWGPLTVRFIVDEDLANWIEIFDWMNGLGFPKSTDQYANLKDETYRTKFGGYFSDATLIIYNNEMIKNKEVSFKNCFPTDLGSIEFDSGAMDVASMSASATFQYTYYEFVT